MVVVEEQGRKRLVFPQGPGGTPGAQERNYRQCIEQLGEGEEILMRLKSMPRRQGTQSMRYYRGVVVPDIAAASGITDPAEYQDVHEALAWKFLRIADHPQHGYPRRRSTSKDDMPQEDMTIYIDQCITWAESSIPGCRVRRPNEVDLGGTYAPDYDAADGA